MVRASGVVENPLAETSDLRSALQEQGADILCLTGLLALIMTGCLYPIHPPTCPHRITASIACHPCGGSHMDYTRKWERRLNCLINNSCKYIAIFQFNDK